MKKIWISVVMIAGTLAAAGVIYFSSGSKAVAMPVVLETIQYQFEGGQGSLRLGAEDVIMDLGMISGVKETGSPVWRDLPTATILLEMNSTRKGVIWKLEGLRFIERVNGEDKRVFKPAKIYDSESQKGRAPAVQFLEKNGELPLFWDTAKRCYLYFVFPELPEDVVSGDLVLTYQCKFPDKRRSGYYEDRFELKRKAYSR